MVENSRKDPRAKVLSMTVRYKSATLDEFIEHHSHDVSRGGMYIKTPQPFPPGTLLKFEVKIGADQKLMQGVGRVVWRRQSDEATESHPSGMGVKFIKLDEESKALIGQLVTARPGETSAFDEVTVSSDLPPHGGSEPPLQAVPAAVGNFFPTSDDNAVPPPAPEDRTVMKQAAELLQEALREVGTSSDSGPPTAKRDSDVTKAERKSALMPEQGSSGNLPALKGFHADAASPGKSRVGAASVTNEPSTVPPARAAAAGTARTSGGSLDKGPAADAAKSRSAESRTPKDAKSAGEASAETDSLRSAARRDYQEGPSTLPAAAPAARESKRNSRPGGGLRPVIMLLIVVGVAALVFAITRKSAPPESMEPAASASTPAAEPAPTPVPSPSTEMSAAEIASAAPSAQPSASTSAPAAEPASPPVANSASPHAVQSAAAPLAAQASAEPEQKAVPKQKARAKAAAALKKSTSSAAATTEEPAEAPAEPAAPKSGATETPKPANDSPSTKGAGAAPTSAPAPAPAPAPAHEDSPL
jgi:uncharacterized protein (TIGR02266 family)